MVIATLPVAFFSMFLLVILIGVLHLTASLFHVYKMPPLLEIQWFQGEPAANVCVQNE